MYKEGGVLDEGRMEFETWNHAGVVGRSQGGGMLRQGLRHGPGRTQGKKQVNSSMMTSTAPTEWVGWVRQTR